MMFATHFKSMLELLSSEGDLLRLESGPAGHFQD